MTLTWSFALLLSFGLRFWGVQHPESFSIPPLLLIALLFGPSLGLGIWLYFVGFKRLGSGS